MSSEFVIWFDIKGYIMNAINFRGAGRAFIKFSDSNLVSREISF